MRVLKRYSRLIAAGMLPLAALAGGFAQARPTATFPVAPPPPGPPKVLLAAGFIDVEMGVAIPDAAVVIDGDRIVAAGPAASVTIPANAVSIRLDGKWLVPGLINTHVHLGLRLPGATGAALANETPAQHVLRMAENARLSLESGVTTVRLVGENMGADYALKQAVNAGRVPGPRIETAGPIIVPTGGHGAREVDGPYKFVEAVREQVRDGATWIKIAISGGIADSHGDISGSPMMPEELQTAVAAAHRAGVKVTAHNGSADAADEAIAAGIDGFEHGYHLGDKQLRAMKAKGVWLVPTIVVSQPGARAFYARNGLPDWYLARVDSVGKDHWSMLQQAIRLGVPIALGSDQFPYEENEGTTATVREAELYVDAGMTPLQALRSGTIDAARMMRLEKDVGAIAPGRYADIIALDANPLQKISALRTIGFVMKGGQVVKPGKP
ncbi:MAG: amidohydrolase family protein [Sphingomonadales bacterium]|nr:MAG: amidohydrolase family protein [Sphingomonadales bacterium]